MRLTTQQRDQFAKAAEEMLQRIERRGLEAYTKRQNKGESVRLSKGLQEYRERLQGRPKDRELLAINTELADIFYRVNNASRRHLREQTARRVHHL